MSSIGFKVHKYPQRLGGGGGNPPRFSIVTLLYFIFVKYHYNVGERGAIDMLYFISNNK